MKNQDDSPRYYAQTVKQAAGSFLFQFMGYPVSVLSSLTFARLLGAGKLGLYNLAFTTVNFFGMLAMCVAQDTPMRFIPEFKVNYGEAKVLSFIRYIFFRLISFSLVSSIVLMLLSSHINNVFFRKPELSKLILWMAPCILLITLEKLLIEILKAFKRASRAMLIRLLIEKISRLGLFVILAIVWRPDVLALVVATYFMYFLGVGLPLSQIGLSFIKTEKRIPIEPQERRKITKFSLLAFLVILSGFLSTRFNLLILGAYAEPSAVGIYVIANSLAAFIIMPSAAFNNIFPTNISELYVQKDIKTLSGLYKRSTWITLFCSLIPFLLFIVYSRDTLAIFGRDFLAGERALQILAFSLLIKVSVGSAVFILLMTGYEKYALFNQGALAIINIALAIPFAKRFGISGVALATAISVVAINLISLLEVRLIHGFSPYDKSYIKLFLSGGITFAVLKGLSYILPSNPFIRLSVAGIAAVASMGSIIMVLGLGETEKQMFQTAIEGIRRKKS